MLLLSLLCTKSKNESLRFFYEAVERHQTEKGALWRGAVAKRIFLALGMKSTVLHSTPELDDVNAFPISEMLSTNYMLARTSDDLFRAHVQISCVKKIPHVTSHVF